MALINPTTGSTKFNVVVRRNAVVSLAGEVPVILSEEEEFNIKLVSDVTNGEEIAARDLQEVPDEEIGEDGIWIKAVASKLKGLSQEELIEMVLKLQAQTGAELPIEEVATEVEPDVQPEPEEDEVEPEPEVEEEPKPKSRRRKKPAAEPEEEPESIDEVTTPAESNDDELDVEF